MIKRLAKLELEALARKDQKAAKDIREILKPFGIIAIKGAPGGISPDVED